MHTIKVILMFMLLVVGTGCTYYTPKKTHVSEKVALDIDPNKKYFIRSDQKSARNVKLFRLREESWYGNYAAWTDVAVDMVKQVISDKGGVIVENSPQSLSLSVVKAEGNVRYFNRVRQAKRSTTLMRLPDRYHCYLRLQVETGSGYQNIFEGQAREPMDIASCFDNSLNEAVRNLFSDKNIISYLGGARED